MPDWKKSDKKYFIKRLKLSLPKVIDVEYLYLAKPKSFLDTFTIDLLFFVYFNLVYEFILNPRSKPIPIKNLLALFSLSPK